MPSLNFPEPAYWRASGWVWMAEARGRRVTASFLALAQRRALSSSWALESEAQPPVRELGGHRGQGEPVETAKQGGQARAFLDKRRPRGGEGGGAQSAWGGDSQCPPGLSGADETVGGEGGMLWRQLRKEFC